NTFARRAQYTRQLLQTYCCCYHTLPNNTLAHCSLSLSPLSNLFFFAQSTPKKQFLVSAAKAASFFSFCPRAEARGFHRNSVARFAGLSFASCHPTAYAVGYRSSAPSGLLPCYNCLSRRANPKAVP